MGGALFVGIFQRKVCCSMLTKWVGYDDERLTKELSCGNPITLVFKGSLFCDFLLDHHRTNYNRWVRYIVTLHRHIW